MKKAAEQDFEKIPTTLDKGSLNKLERVENEHGKFIRWEYTKNGETIDGIMSESSLIEDIEAGYKNSHRVNIRPKGMLLKYLN